MKPRYPLIGLIAAALLPLTTQAQLLTDWEIIKGIDYEQTSSADPTVKAGNAYFWESLFKVAGGDTVTGSPTTNAAGGTAGTQIHMFDGDDSEWGVSLESTSQSGIDAQVNDGSFTTNITFTTAGTQGGSLNVASTAGITYFAENPKVTTLANAAWVGGKLQVTAGTTATINFNGLSVAGFTDNEDLMFVNIDNFGEINQSTAFGSFTIGSGGDFNLVAGTYELEIEYVNYTEVNTTSFAGSTGRGGFLNNALIVLEVLPSAVPEPSSFALLGGLAMFGVALRRRRRTA